MTWIDREQKRLETLAKDLEEAVAALSQRRSDLTTKTEKLALLKTELINEEKNSKPGAMDIDGISPEAEADAHMLQVKELALRRQIARKRSPDGKILSAKQLKDMETEATQISRCSEALEKRRKKGLPAEEEIAQGNDGNVTPSDAGSRAFAAAAAAAAAAHKTS